MALIIVGLTGLYLLLFLMQQIPPGIRRADLLVGLLIPDALLENLVGGGSGNAAKISFLDRLPPMALAVIWLAVGFFIGDRPTRRLQASMSRWEQVALACLLGLSLLSTAVLLLGLMGQLSRLSLLGCAVVLWVVGRWLGQREFSAKPSVVESTSSRQSLNESSRTDRLNNWQPIASEVIPGQVATWLSRLVPVGVLMLAVIYVLSSLMPPFEFDVVEYHLQGPKEFYQQGRIAFCEHNVYLNMPLAAEMHSLAMMVLVGGPQAWWLGGLAGKTLTGIFSLLGALLVAGWAGRNWGRQVGWSAAAILLSAPGNLHVASCGLIDAVLGSYILACTLCLQSALESSRRDQADWPTWSVLACFFAGSAAACKYTGVVFAVFPTALTLVWIGYRRWAEPGWWRVGAACLLAVLVSALPWYAKNWASTGNPVYPLASSLFGSGNLTEDQIARWNRAHQVPQTSDGKRYGWQAWSSASAQVVLQSEYLPLALVPLTVLAMLLFVWKPKRAPLAMALLMMLWILAVWFFATHRIDRFLVPILPLAVMLASYSLQWLNRSGYQSWTAALMLFSLLYAGLLSLSNIACDSRWLVSYESLKRDIGTAEVPGRLSPGIDWLNHQLPATARVLLVGQAQVFRYQPPIYYATCFNTPVGESALNSGDPELARRWLQDQGITHVLVQWSEINRYRSPGNYGFSAWPTRSDIDLLMQWNLLRRVEQDWPMDWQASELLEVVQP